MRASSPLFVALAGVVTVVCGAHWRNHVSDSTPAPVVVATTAANSSFTPFQEELLQSLATIEYQTPPFMACFAPGTPIEVVERFHRQLHAPLLQGFLLNSQPREGRMTAGDDARLRPSARGGPQFFQAPDFNRWTTTATDGSGLARGQPIILTWGIVSDTTFIEDIDPVGDPDETGPGANSDLRARLDALYTNEATWLPIFEAVFDRWGELTGITYQYESADDGVDLFNSPGVVSVRPDIRIGGRLIDGNSGILAFNFFPLNGDMVIDTADNFFNDTSGNSVKMRNVLAHEHGHGLGIAHVCPVQQTKLMEPFVSTAFDGPQHDDTRAGQRLYGDHLEHNDSFETATDRGVLGTGSTLIEDVSLDGDNDVDFYKFSTDVANREVTLTLTPIGFSYLNGAQNTSDGSCQAGTLINSIDDRNLGVDLLDTDGSSLLASMNVNPAGQDEVLTHMLGNSTGPFYASVTGDGTDVIQLYTLELTFVAAAADDLSVAVNSIPEPVLLGQIQTIEITANHTGPGDATSAAAMVTLPAGLDYLGSAMSSGSGTLSFENGTVTADLGTLVGASSAAFLIEARRMTMSDLSIMATITRAESDPDASNDTASVLSAAVATTATDVEDFNAFPGVSGTPGSIPNDTTGSFELIWGPSTTTTKGFALDQALAKNGRGLEYDYDEDTGLWLSQVLSASDYAERAYQIAFWFRYSDVSTKPNGSFTQLFLPYNQNANPADPTDIAFLLRCGKGPSGNEGLGISVPSNSASIQSFDYLPVTSDAWHTCVVHYTSATSPSASDAGIAVYIDPANASATPQFQIATTDGTMSSYLGDGALARYAFGAALFFADDDGPTVWLDRIGTWDGFGIAGQNDLQTAIDFLYPTAAVLAVAPSADEGDASVTNVDFRIVRVGETEISAVYDWAVTGSGTKSADAADFAGSALPTGQVTFAAGETVKTFSVSISGDHDVEDDESYLVTLTGGDGYARVSASASSVVASISNDDSILTEVAADLDGAQNLLITDINAVSDDDLTLQSDTTNSQFVLADANDLLTTSINGVTGDLTSTLLIPFAEVSGESILLQPGAGSDTVGVDYSLGGFSKTIIVDGGIPGDILSLTNGTFTNAVFAGIDANSGSVTLDANDLVQYSSLESIRSTLVVSDPSFSYSANNDVVGISSPGSGQLLIDSDFGAPTTIANPSGSLTVSAGDGDDIITVTSLDSPFPASVTINGELGSNSLNLATNLGFAAGKTLTVTEMATAFSIREVSIGGDISLTGQLHFNLDGNNAGTDHDQLIVTGESRVLDLTGTALSLTVSFDPSVNDVLTIIDLDDAGSSTTGTFTGLAEGSQITADGHAFTISYAGGTDDNDIVLKGTLDYGEWAASAFVSAPAEDQDIDDNPDHDAWLNGFEYLFGLGPEMHDADPITLTTGATEATIAYPRFPDVPVGIEILEASTNMVDWSSVTPISTMVQSQGATDLVTVTVPVNAAVRVFYRLCIP